MKRVLSLLVVLAMILAMAPTTFAANTDIDFDDLIGVSEPLSDISEVNVSLDEGAESVTYTWTPETDGILTFAIGELAEDLEVEVILSQADNSAKLSDSADGTVTLPVTAGIKVRIIVSEANAAAAEFVLTGTMVSAGTESNPIMITETSVELTVPAGETMYYAGRFSGMIMSFEGEDVVVANNGKTYEPVEGVVSFEVTGGDFFNPPVIAITNNAEEDATYAVSFDYPVGTQMNPEIIWDLSEIKVSLAEGNSQGYYLSYFNRAAEGTISLSVSEATEGVEYDVILSSTGSYSMPALSESEDGTVKIDVKPQDTVTIQVVVWPGADFVYPAAEIKLAGEFIFPAGSRENPEPIFNPANIVVDIAEGNNQGYYYSWFSRADGTLTLTCPEIEGVQYDVVMTNMTTYDSAWLQDSTDGTVSIEVAAGDEVIIQVTAIPAEGSYDYPALKTTLTGEFVFPIGTRENPEAIFNPASIAVDIAAGNDQGYYYSWFSRADGTLTLTCPEIEGTQYDVVMTNMTTYENAWLQDSTDGTVSMKVAAGDQVIIQVTAIPAEGSYDYPALQTTLTGEFEYPIGTRENPEAIFNATSIAVDVAEGNNQGYYYKWTSNAEGTLILTCPTIEGAEYDVVMTNMTTYENAWLQDSTDGTVSIEIGVGDEIVIQVVAIPAEGSYDYPALKTTLAGSFVAPVGSNENPEVLEELGWTDVVLEEGDNDGYYYSFTAPADGDVTLYLSGEVEGDIVVTNLTTSVQKILSVDGVDNFGLELQLEVTEGDELLIQVVAVPDENNVYPAAEIVLSGMFTYPEGTEQNPIVPDWEMNDEWTEGSATVKVPAGETLYFAGMEGMLLSINGGEPTLMETTETTSSMIVLTNEGETEAEYLLEVWYPVGTRENPEALEELNGSVKLDEGDYVGYFYSYTAKEDGTISLKLDSVTEGVGADISLFNNTTYEMVTLSADGVNGQVAIEASAGDVITINVVAQPDDDWNYPAADVSFSGEITKGIPGDMDGNGDVTDADAMYLLRHTLLPERYPITLDGDVNGDGVVTDADAMYLLRYTLLPERYPLYPEAE